MTLWLDNQLPPALSLWMSVTFSVDCHPVRDLSLQRASDSEIFTAARLANAVVMTKDADFVDLLEHRRYAIVDSGALKDAAARSRTKPCRP